MIGPVKVVSGTAHPELTQDICKHLGCERCLRARALLEREHAGADRGERARGGRLRGPTLLPARLGRHHRDLHHDRRPEARSAGRITAVIPYFPYFRSDKKDRPRLSITARLMANLVETAGANRVLTMDLHAPQIQGFFGIPVDHLQAAPILCDYLRESRDLSNYVLVAGDVGESKEAGEYATRLDLPIAIVDKRRYGDDESPRATHLIGDVGGKIALVVDDEVASGGTLLEGGTLRARAGRRRGGGLRRPPRALGEGHRAHRGLAAAPARGDGLDPLPPQKRIDKIRVQSVARLFADAIRAIHDGSSISRLFR